MAPNRPQHQPARHIAASPPARPGGGQLRMLIADHDGLARSMLRAALRQTAVIHTAANEREALELARYYQPIVAIIDTALPPHGSIELIPKLRALAPQTQILTISIDDQPAALAALRAGAIGHITKDTQPDKLAHLIQQAAQGEPIVPQSLIKPLLKLIREIPQAGWRPLHSRLTTREWEIVEHLDQNHTTQQIADHLVLSPTTVYSHIKSIMHKLGVHTRHDAITAAQTLRREEILDTEAADLLKGA